MAKRLIVPMGGMGMTCPVMIICAAMYLVHDPALMHMDT